MIQNVPSIYNQPSVYNGGGGLPGDFGTPGASILPEQYRQVAAVYIPHGKHTNAYKTFRFSDYGLQQFDNSVLKIKSGVYRTTPLHTGGGSYVSLFYIQTGSKKTYINYYPMGNPKKYQLRNGGSSTDVNIPGGDLLGIHDLILKLYWYITKENNLHNCHL